MCVRDTCEGGHLQLQQLAQADTSDVSGKLRVRTSAGTQTISWFSSVSQRKCSNSCFREAISIPVSERPLASLFQRGH
jgi:hypothetical protein